ncbi:MAG TPA: hypothetical protein VFE58_02440 [Tepidisphaeraceae bacterium]|jgi:hypothetical protein|nr:hypothetical protein [Tepidisphaeraceae bacterium]
MPSSEPNFDLLGLVKQIVDLNAEFCREVAAKQYARAAALRDQREALQQQLNQSRNPIVAKNVQRLLQGGLTRAPILSLLEQDESAVDDRLLHLVRRDPLPPRWLLDGYGGSCRATVAKLLNVDALESNYFQAQLPVFSQTTLSKATKPMEWVAVAIREAAREMSPVVWIITEPAYLAERGILDVLLQLLRVPSTQFVICLGETDAPFAASFREISGVTAMGGK